MFQLTKEEFENLRFQSETSRWGGRRYLPCVFTEQGIAMLSSVLSSKRAIQVNVHIMRTFTKLRELMSNHAEVRHKIEEMEQKYDYQFNIVFEAIKKLMDTPQTSGKPIGFHVSK